MQRQSTYDARARWPQGATQESPLIIPRPRPSDEVATGTWEFPELHAPAPGQTAPAVARSHDDAFQAPPAPEPPHAGGRLLLILAFWFMLATSIELWWLDTPGHSVTGVGGVLTEGGRITGMIGGFVLLVQVLLMSRLRFLERLIGGHSLLIWHRELGGALVILILAHVVLIIEGYALTGGTSAVHETWSMLTTLPDMISAALGTGILVGIGLLAIRALRRRMRYEVWYFLHLSSYLILLLGYGHQFADGQELMNGGFGTWYWTALYLLVVAGAVWGRLVGPIAFNLRHRLKVVDVVTEGNDMVSIYVSGHGLDDLRVRAGQYFRWRFLTTGCWWQAHPFSLSAAPNGRWLRLTIKVVGDHTGDLQYLEPGVRVFAEGPSGMFTADRRVKPRALLIAGGSGIAPIRALLEDLPPGAAVIYRAGKAEDIVFREELDWLAQRRQATVWYVLGSRDDPWPKHVFTPRGLRQIAPDVRRRDIYLCGPQGLVDASLQTLRRLRVPHRQIHLDPFEF